MRNRAEGRRLLWAVLAWLHRAGLSRVISYLANRFERSDARPYVRRRRHGTVQILIYHRVGRRPDSYLPATPLPAFERQMECLARRFHVLDLAEAVEALEQDCVPRNAVVVTFDDGYRDNFDVAYPVLTALSVPATIFLATGVIGTDDILWHDRVFRMFAETEAREVPEFGPERVTLSLEAAGGRQESCLRALGYLRKLGPDQRDEHIDRLARALGEKPPGDRLMLSWEEVRQMHRGGISFGAHTVSHPVLSRVSLEQATREIVESKREIERHLATSITTFAYPNGRPGDFGPATKRVLAEAGYRCALTTIRGTNSPPDLACDRFELRRGGPDDPDAARFEARMNAYRFLS